MVAVVTGGARGQGLAAALALAREGADVAICDVEPDAVRTVFYELAGSAALKEAANQIASLGVEVVAEICDVSDQSQVDHFIEVVVDRLGGIDVLVNNAGISTTDVPAHELTDEQW